MNPLANSKSVVSLLGTGVTNGATVTANIDTLGCKGFLSVDLITGTANVVSNTFTTLKLSHSDDTVVTNFADISGFVGGTDFTIAAMNTSDANVYRFEVDLRGKKRYIKLTAAVRTTQEMVMAARLSHRESAVKDATTGNVTQIVGV
jgi:hypothetical protein